MTCHCGRTKANHEPSMHRFTLRKERPMTDQGEIAMGTDPQRVAEEQPTTEAGRALVALDEYDTASLDDADFLRIVLRDLITNVEYLMEEHGTRVIDIEDLRAVAYAERSPAQTPQYTPGGLRYPTVEELNTGVNDGTPMLRPETAALAKCVSAEGNEFMGHDWLPRQQGAARYCPRCDTFQTLTETADAGALDAAIKHLTRFIEDHAYANQDSLFASLDIIRGRRDATPALDGLISPGTVDDVAAAMHAGRLTGCTFTGGKQACSPLDHAPDARSYLAERREAILRAAESPTPEPDYDAINEKARAAIIAVAGVEGPVVDVWGRIQSSEPTPEPDA